MFNFKKSKKTLSFFFLAIQQVLVGYPFKVQQCVHVYPKLPNYPFPYPSPAPATISSFSVDIPYMWNLKRKDTSGLYLQNRKGLTDLSVHFLALLSSTWFHSWTKFHGEKGDNMAIGSSNQIGYLVGFTQVVFCPQFRHDSLKSQVLF